MSANLNKALTKAAGSGCLDTVKRLLVKDVDPKENISKPLHAAAMNGHLEVVRLLLSLADPEAFESWALQAAAESGHLEIVKLLLPVSGLKDGTAASVGGRERSS